MYFLSSLDQGMKGSQVYSAMQQVKISGKKVFYDIQLTHIDRLFCRCAVGLELFPSPKYMDFMLLMIWIQVASFSFSKSLPISVAYSEFPAVINTHLVFNSLFSVIFILFLQPQEMPSKGEIQALSPQIHGSIGLSVIKNHEEVHFHGKDNPGRKAENFLFSKILPLSAFP